MEPDGSGIRVVHERELAAGASTPGIARHRAFEDREAIVSQSRIAGGVASDWHHHGTRTLYGFLVRGDLSFEYGPGGRREVRFTAGDYFRVSPGVVHRDVNPDPKREAVVVAFLVGEGPAVVNTRGPDP